MSDYDYIDGGNITKTEFLSTNILVNNSISDASFDDLFLSKDLLPHFSSASSIKREENQYYSQQLDALLNTQLEHLNRPKLSDIFINSKLIPENDFQVILNSIADVLTLEHPELTPEDKKKLEETINDKFTADGLSTRIIFDCFMNHRTSRHDETVTVYTAYCQSSFLDSGANGSIKKPIAELKLNENNTWTSKPYTEDTLNKVIKEVTVLKKYNDKTLEERLADITHRIKDLEGTVNNNSVKSIEILKEIHEKIYLYKQHNKLLSSLTNEFEAAKKAFLPSSDEHKSFHLLPKLGFMYMPYQRGITLEKIMLRNTKTIEESIEILHNIFLALHKLHEKNLTHNDFRSANIIIKDNNQAILVDFGLAAEIGEKHNGNINLVCAAPEIYNQKYQNLKNNSLLHDPAQDIFSFGLIYQQMLYGARNRIWELQEITDEITFDANASEQPASSTSDDALKEICTQVEILESKVILLLNNGDYDNAVIPMQHESPTVSSENLLLDKKYELEVPNAVAMLLNVDSNKPSTTSLFISTSKPNAAVRITGVKFDGTLEHSQLSNATQTMIEELGAGLLAINPHDRFSHQQINEKFIALSNAIKAEQQTNILRAGTI